MQIWENSAKLITENGIYSRKKYKVTVQISSEEREDITMKGMKSLLQNKKIQAAILIFLICVLFIAVLVSSRSGKNNSIWSYGEATDSDAQETTIILEEITRELEAEVETDTNGKIFSILVEDETIDLSSDEIETEKKSDGSVTYKVGDDTNVVINTDGTVKVIKTETVTKVVTVNSNQNNQTSGNGTSGRPNQSNQPSVQNPNKPNASSSEQNTYKPSPDEIVTSPSPDEIVTSPSSEETKREPVSEDRPSEEESSKNIESSGTDALTASNMAEPEL